MAVAHYSFKRPGETQDNHVIAGLQNVVEPILVGAGTLRWITIIQPAASPSDLYVKLWDQATVVDPEADDPDWQFEFLEVVGGPGFEFDEQEKVNSFDNGLQVNVSGGKGLNDSGVTAITVVIGIDQN